MVTMLQRTAVGGLALAAAFWAATARADIVRTPAVPSGEVRGGATVPATIYFLNPGPADAAADAPAQLPATLVAGATTKPVLLTRRGNAPLERLQPGRFVAVEYTLQVPTDVAGRVAIQLDGAESGATLAVTPAASQPPTGVAPPTTSATAPVADAPNSRPFDLSPKIDPATLPAVETSIAEYVPWRFSAHEPIYFVAGPDRPNAKFQVSFKYQLFDPEAPLAKAFWPVSGLHVAYSQTSLWDWEGESAPFFDSSYRPEVLWVAPDLKFDRGLVSRIGLQAGLQHESNGKSGEDSRSLNIVYVRPSITFGDRDDGWFVTLAPRFQAYVFGFDEGNDNIKDYRGYGELSVIAGQRNGLQLRTTARVGDDWDKGSIQFDLSHPIGPLVGNNIDLYLHAQYFNGFGESLLEFDESTSVFRLGLSIVR
jgi:outer membrane phospholipase A